MATKRNVAQQVADAITDRNHASISPGSDGKSIQIQMWDGSVLVIPVDQVSTHHTRGNEVSADFYEPRNVHIKAN